MRNLSIILLSVLVATMVSSDVHAKKKKGAISVSDSMFLFSSRVKIKALGDKGEWDVLETLLFFSSSDPNSGPFIRVQENGDEDVGSWLQTKGKIEIFSSAAWRASSNLAWVDWWLQVTGLRARWTLTKARIVYKINKKGLIKSKGVNKGVFTKENYRPEKVVLRWKGTAQYLGPIPGGAAMRKTPKANSGALTGSMISGGL